MAINFARLNHILIPTTKDGRDRLRRGWMGKAIRPIGFFYSRLSAEGRLFAAASFVAAGFGFEVRNTEAYILSSALAALVLAALFFVPLFKMKGVTLEVSAPRRIAAGEPVTFTVVAKNDGSRAERGLRFAGPFLPWDGRWATSTASLPALEPGSSAKVEMSARFTMRGEHHLDPFHAQALVPFGLTLGPEIKTGGCKFLVVPKIAHVARLTTPQGRRHQPGGILLASQTGEAMDLRGVRPYRPGDPVRDLHARSWARLGSPVVREYKEEYFTRVAVVLDIDQGAADERRLEAAITLAAGVVARLSRGEALIDLLVVGQEVHSLTLGRSLGFFEQALDLLACVERGGPFDAETLAERLAPHLGRVSSVLFVALAWDDARAAFLERVRARGVGARAFVVEKDRAPAGEVGPGVLSVPVGQIERGEALAL